MWKVVVLWVALSWAGPVFATAQESADGTAPAAGQSVAAYHTVAATQYIEKSQAVAAQPQIDFAAAQESVDGVVASFAVVPAAGQSATEKVVTVVHTVVVMQYIEKPQATVAQPQIGDVIGMLANSTNNAVTYNNVTMSALAFGFAAIAVLIAFVGFKTIPEAKEQLRNEIKSELLDELKQVVEPIAAKQANSVAAYYLKMTAGFDQQMNP